MIKILYNQKQARRTFVFGILAVVLGILAQIYRPNYLLGGFIGIGIVYIVTYIAQTFSPYVLITTDFIQRNSFPIKKIALKDITEIKYFAGDYIIKKPGKEIVIDTNYIDKESLPLLRQFVDDFVKR